MNREFNIPAFRVMFADDQTLFVQGLCGIIKKIFPESKCSIASSLQKAKKELRQNNYKFLVIDLYIQGENVMEFINYCKKEFPETVIIIISSNIEISAIKKYFHNQVRVFLSKSISYEELQIAFEKAYKGENYISADLSKQLTYRFFEESKTELTKKELEILRLVAGGYSVKAAAELLRVSPYTILSHRRNIMKKLNIHSAAKLVKYAFENKLV